MPQTWVRTGTLQAAVPARVTATGTAAIGALAAGATKTISVTLDRIMPGTAYRAQLSIAGTTTQLTAVEVLGVVAASRTTTVCPVMVRATASLTTGATVEVVAVA